MKNRIVGHPGLTSGAHLPAYLRHRPTAKGGIFIGGDILSKQMAGGLIDQKEQGKG